MSVWKSPLLYLGCIVILLAAVAFAGPFFINWSSYRADFEKYGYQLTGRKAEIKGDIEVRLFPWPVMRLKDVRIANPPGAQVAELLRAEEMEVRLELAPLLSGKLKVAGVDINRPTIGLERMATGKWTWEIAPKDGFVEVFGAENVAVSDINILNGTVVLADGRRGGEARVHGFNALVTARSLNGPWRMRGTAIAEEEEFALSVNTGKYRKGSPLKFSVKLEPMERVGLAYTFDGQTGGGQGGVSGKVQVEPAAKTSGKAEAKANFRPIVMRADVRADFDNVDLANIEIAPKNAVDARSFLKGAARIGLGEKITVNGNLKAAHFDIDSILGGKGRKTLRSGRLLEALGDVIARLPVNVRFKTRLGIDTFVFAGEKVEQVDLDVDISNERIRLNSLNMSLGSQTKAAFKGIFLPDNDKAQLIGDLKLDAISAKDFAKWAFPDKARDIEARWSGARGRLKVKTKVDLSPVTVRLSDVELQVDDHKVTGGLRVSGGDNPIMDLTLKAPMFDLDRYAPEGLLTGDEKKAPFKALVDLIASTVAVRNLHFAAKFDRLLAAGVTVDGFEAEIEADESGVALRRLKIAGVGDASVDVSGHLKVDDETVAGNINGRLDAENPAALVRFLGLAGDDDPQWLKSITPLKLTVTGDIQTKDKESAGSFTANGQAGNSDVKLKGNVTGTIADWQKAKLHFSGQLKTRSAREMATFLGIELKGDVDGDGRLAFSATGDVGNGLATTADLSMFGAQSQFSGVVWRNSEGGVLGTRGRLALLVENTDEFFSVLGLPAGEATPLAKVLSAEGGLETTGTKFELKGVRGTAGGTTFKGGINGQLAGKDRNLSAKLSVGRMSLVALLDQLMLPLDGKDHSTTTRFSLASTLDFPIDLELTAREFSVTRDIVMGKASVSISVDEKQVALKAAGATAGGKPMKLDLTASGNAQLTSVRGSVEGAMPISALIADQGGAPVFDGEVHVKGNFSGKGRTPGGVIAALSGSGTFEVSNGKLHRITPGEFGNKVISAETPAEVDKLVKDVLRRGELEIGGGNGNFSMEAGVIRFEPVAFKAGGADGKLRGIYEAVNGLLDLSVSLQLQEHKKVPPFEIAYSGEPRHLKTSVDLAALKSYISVLALNRTMDKLDQLQEEQKKLLDEQKKLQAEEAAKREEQRKRQLLLLEKQRKLLREQEQKDKQTPPGTGGDENKTPKAVPPSANAADKNNVSENKPPVADSGNLVEVPPGFKPPPIFNNHNESLAVPRTPTKVKPASPQPRKPVPVPKRKPDVAPVVRQNNQPPDVTQAQPQPIPQFPGRRLNTTPRNWDNDEVGRDR